jgi:ADP-heptose:LPS heptosyltransferase
MIMFDLIKRLERRWLPYLANSLDSLIARARREGKHRFLFVWNYGLGDTALWAEPLCVRIRRRMPQAQITFLAREDNADTFKLLRDVRVIADPLLKRKQEVDLDATLERLGYSRDAFDYLLDRRYSTRWLYWAYQKHVPRLVWRHEWDDLANHFPLHHHEYIALHADTETGHFYSWNKNWSQANWSMLIKILTESYGKEIILFGMKKDDYYSIPGVIDLRGKTSSILDVLSIIKNRCQFLLAPDSGILSLIYYIDTPFDLNVISLWCSFRFEKWYDQGMGILMLGKSPNPKLSHEFLMRKNINDIQVGEVVERFVWMSNQTAFKL